MKGCHIGFRVESLGSKLLKGGYTRDYVGDYCRRYCGGILGV